MIFFIHTVCCQHSRVTFVRLLSDGTLDEFLRDNSRLSCSSLCLGCMGCVLDITRRIVDLFITLRLEWECSLLMAASSGRAAYSM